MLIFFNDIVEILPLWELVMILIISIIVFSFLLAIRGFYVLFTLTPKQTFIYLGTIFGIFLIIWITFLITKSNLMRIVCICFGLPFGLLARQILQIELSEPLIYLGATIFNLVAWCGAIELGEKIIAKMRLS